MAYHPANARIRGLGFNSQGVSARLNKKKAVTFLKPGGELRVYRQVAQLLGELAGLPAILNGCPGQNIEIFFGQYPGHKPWAEQTPQILPSMSNPKVRFSPWSWSSDGRKLAGWEARTGEQLGLGLYFLEPQCYEKLTDFGTRPTWLSDDRKLLFYYKDKLYLVDSKSKNKREVLSTGGHEITGLALSKDDRHIYFSLKIAEADIWLMSRE